jgi:DNA-binding NtrC family response regulator
MTKEITVQEKNIPPRVLIVDDEPDITEVLKMGLELKGGFQVDTFNNPQDALLHFRPGFYDLLLSDIKMPHLNGFELYSKIRDVDKEIRVCFITAFQIYYDEFRELFPRLDVRCFANKPVSIDKLVELIREELSLPNLNN